MNRFIPIFILIFSFRLAFAQSLTKLTIGASLNPLLCNSFNSENTLVTDDVYLHNNAVRTIQSFRLNILLPALWFNYSFDEYKSLQTGLGYQDVGFQKNQDNIKYLDPLFTGIPYGKRMDFTSSEASIHYEYRFQYLQIPVLFNYLIGKSRDYQISYSLTGGVAFNFLLAHKITANLLDGYYIDGKQKFNLTPTGYDPRFFAFNFIAGGRMDYKLDKKITLMVQPVLSIYPFSVTSGAVSVNPYYFAVNTGIVYDIVH